MSGKRLWDGYRKRLLHFSLILSCVALLSAGIAVPAHAQDTVTQPGDHDVQITVGGVNREFILHVPTKYDGSTAEPLVLMLHGHGGTAKEASKVGWTEQADINTFIVAYPQAVAADPTKPVGKGNVPTWNDGSKRTGLPPVDDVAFLKAVISYIETNLKIDTQRVYLAGFSQGAMLTFYAAVNMSDQLAAIGMVSGAFLEYDDPSLKLTHQLPLIYMIGTADQLIPVNGGRSPDLVQGTIVDKPPVQVYLDAWLKLNQCATASPALIPDQNGVAGKVWSCDPNFQLVYYTIQNMVHIWPVGPKASNDAVNAADSESAEGTGDVPTQDVSVTATAVANNGFVRPIFKINGAMTMWQFFTKYTLTGAVQH